MGTSHSGKELTGKLRNVETVVADRDRRVVNAMTDGVKRTLERSAAQSGLRKGSKIAGRSWRGVYVRRVGNGMAVGYSKPAKLVNDRTKAHVIGAKGLGTRATISKKVTAATVVSALSGQAAAASFKGRKGAKALKINGDFAAYVRHPGTRGKHFFERAKPQAKREGAQEARRSVVTGLAGIFR